MSISKELMRRFWNDESAQGLVEYVLIIALVSVGLMLVMVMFRNEMGSRLDEVSTTLQNAQTAPYPAAGAAGS